jgi:hypothetical protein
MSLGLVFSFHEPVSFQPLLVLKYSVACSQPNLSIERDCHKIITFGTEIPLDLTLYCSASFSR